MSFPCKVNLPSKTDFDVELKDKAGQERGKPVPRVLGTYLVRRVSGDRKWLSLGIPPSPLEDSPAAVGPSLKKGESAWMRSRWKMLLWL